MCLMCEFYLGTCAEPECVAKATGEELFTSRKGTYQYFLWKGYSEPCEHIKAEHGPECEIFNPEVRECNCDIYSDGRIVYY